MMSGLLPCLLSAAVLLTLLMTGSSSLSPFSWADCSPPDSPAVVNKILVQPVPMKIGREWNITASFELKEEVTDGSINFTLHWSPDGKQFIVLVHQELYLCDFVQKVHIKCPIQIGHHNILYKNNAVSSILPQGFYCFQLTLEDQLNKQCCLKGCIQIEL